MGLVQNGCVLTGCEDPGGIVGLAAVVPVAVSAIDCAARGVTRPEGVTVPRALEPAPIAFCRGIGGAKPDIGSNEFAHIAVFIGRANRYQLAAYAIQCARFGETDGRRELHGGLDVAVELSGRCVVAEGRVVMQQGGDRRRDLEDADVREQGAELAGRALHRCERQRRAAPFGGERETALLHGVGVAPGPVRCLFDGEVGLLSCGAHAKVLYRLAAREVSGQREDDLVLRSRLGCQILRDHARCAAVEIEHTAAEGR